MTITEARKIWGKLSNNLSDAEVEHEIETANLLKDLFFKFTYDKKTPLKSTSLESK